MQQGICICRATSPEIAIVDLDFKQRDPFDVAAEIASTKSVTRRIFLARQFTDVSLERALEAQASGLLLKRESFSTLLTAIRRVYRGHFCFSGEIEQRVVYNHIDQAYSVSAGTGLSSLTDRQKEVLSYLAIGLSFKEVAHRMQLSYKSIDTHKYRIMTRLGINDRVKLARFAIREGLVDL